MPNYRAGTVGFTNGSPVVTGSGTLWNGNVNPGDILKLTNGTDFEILSVDSNTQLTLAENYPGSTASGLSYRIDPGPGAGQIAALDAMRSLITTYSGIANSAGVGIFSGGSVSAPTIRRSDDLNTGLFLEGSDTQSLVTGGVRALTADASQRIQIGGTGGNSRLNVFGNGLDLFNFQPASAAFNYGTFRDSGGTPIGFIGGGGGGASVGGTASDFAVRYQSRLLFSYGGSAQGAMDGSGNFGWGTITPGAKFHVAGGNLRLSGGYNIEWASGDHAIAVSSDGSKMAFYLGGPERGQFDNSGNFMVGATGVGAHALIKSVSEGSLVGIIGSAPTGNGYTAFYGTAGTYGNGAGSAINVPRNSSTLRSINAGGTVNASGADVAEAKWKRSDCGTVARGQVCGLDANGMITDRWSMMKLPRFKTGLIVEPGFVMGDNWGAPDAICILDGQPLGPAPKAPIEVGPAPTAPAPFSHPLPDTDDAAAVAAYEHAQSEHAVALAAYGVALSQHNAAVTAYNAAVAEYESALAAWQPRFDANRAAIDRLVYCGTNGVRLADKVGSRNPEGGDYIVLVEKGTDEIGWSAVAPDDMTFAQLRWSIGRVERVEESGVPLVAASI